jgi:hypothetical protein
VVDAWTKNINRNPEPHWANTSGNDIVRRLVDAADTEMKTDLETLMAGNTISKVIHEDITYQEIDDDAENFWNFLFFTGYLKKEGDGRQNDDGELMLDLSIPNIELKYIYKTKIQEWFKKRIAGKNLDALQSAVLNGDAETLQSELSAILSESISYMDSAESLYHGVMIGVFARLNGYRRSDLVLYNANENGGKAVIFEFKLAPNAKTLAKACEDALKQIEDKNYAAYWDEEGYKNIIKYGIGFYKKRCEVRKG